MNIVFHHKGIDLAEDFKPIAEEKLLKLQRYNLQLSDIKVDILRSDKKNQKNKLHHVELSTWHREIFIHAAAEGVSDLTAFDKAIKNLQLQMSRIHERKLKIQHDPIRGHLPDILPPV
jgi:ribosomal subunit interface protein